MSIQIVLVFLATAGVVVPLANRLRVSPVLVFLVAGAVLGPTGLGRLVGPEDFLAHFLMPPGEGVAVLAEFGVVFLMFLIGLDLSPGRLWALRRLVFGLGTAQVVVGALAIGLIAYAFGNSPLASLVLGVCLAFSSTAIVLPILSETGRAASTLGRAALAVLLLQDIAVVPALLLVDLGDIVDGAGPGTAYRLLVSIAKGGIAIGAIVIAGHFIARPLLRIVAQSKSPEFFAAFVLLAAIGTALVTEQVGLPMTMGAFLAGLLLAESEYRHEISVAMAPFKGLLLGVFFMSVGLRVDLAAFVADPFWMIASVIGLIVLKAALILPLARAFGMTWHHAVELGLILGPAGEFALVVITAALANQMLSPAVGQFMLLTAMLSMMTAPILARLARPISRRLAPPSGAGLADAPLPADTESAVVVIGHGRVGSLLCRLMRQQDMPFIAFDTNPQAVAAARRAGEPVYYANAGRSDLLHRIGIQRAAMAVITIDDPDAAEQIAATIRRLAPEIVILARARDLAHALKLEKAGATKAVPETLESSLQLASSLLTTAGIPEEALPGLIEPLRSYEWHHPEDERPN